MQVLGINLDGQESHCSWHAREKLPYHLLSAAGSDVAQRYGVDKKLLFLFQTVARVTFLIDPEGRVAHVWESVSPRGHAEEVLSELKRRNMA